MKKLFLLITVFVLISVSGYAQNDDVSIDSNGNVTTGANASANLEVIGASAETAITGISFDNGGTGVSGAHYTGGAVLESAGLLGNNQTGVYGYGIDWAGYFQGNVRIENDLTVDGTITGLDTTYVNEGQSSSITSLMIVDGTIAPADVSFNYAGSATRGGPAMDLACSTCVSIGELDFTPSLSTHDHNSDYVNVTGDTMTGDLNVNSSFINTTGEYRIDGNAVLNVKSFNTLVGQNAGFSMISGISNTFVGYGSGGSNATGVFNTLIGSGAGVVNTSNYNTIVGANAGINNLTGSRNVFIGYQAGYNETGSDKLYIANGSIDSDVLISGDFAQTLVGIGTVTPLATFDVRNPSGNTYGLIGSGSEGVFGKDNVSSNWGRLGSSLYGAEGYSNTGTAVRGQSGSGTGVKGESTSGTGGYFNSISGYGLIIESGNVGIGKTSPTHKLHIAGSDDALRIEGTGGGTLAYLGKLNFGDNNFVYLQEDDDDKLTIYADKRTAIMGGDVGIGTMTPAGTLDVNGTIFQRGGSLHADYVFEPDYNLESIRDHAQFMWKNKHLKAIPQAMVDKNGQEIVEVGSHRKGIVEELEKAHIYIEQLHTQLNSQHEEIIKLKGLFLQLETQVDSNK